MLGSPGMCQFRASIQAFLKGLISFSPEHTQVNGHSSLKAGGKVNSIEFLAMYWGPCSRGLDFPFIQVALGL